MDLYLIQMNTYTNIYIYIYIYILYNIFKIKYTLSLVSINV